LKEWLGIERSVRVFKGLALGNDMATRP
jgi:hypothetical protein